MNGWASSGSLKANKHWQSGNGKQFDLLKLSSFPYSRTEMYPNYSSPSMDPVKTVKALNTKLYAYVWTGLDTCGTCGAGEKVKNDYAVDNSSVIARYLFVIANKYIKTVSAVTSELIFTKKIKIVTVPNEWKNKDIYLLDYHFYNNRWTIGYPGTSTGGGDYLYNQTLYATTEKNTGNLATKIFSEYYSSDITGYKVVPGTVYTEKQTLAESDHWSDKIGLAAGTSGFTFIADDSSNEAEEELTGSFKIEVSYEPITSDAENG